MTKSQFAFLRKFFIYGSRIAPDKAARLALKIFASTTRYERPAIENEYLKTAKKITLDNRLTGFIWGKSGPFIALVHGWNGRASQMGALAEPLVNKGFRVVAFDGPAHGESPGNESNPSEFANYIVSIQNEYSPLVGVIAHSFGAGCSVLATRRGLQIKKLVLIASPARYINVCYRYTKMLGLSPKAEKLFLHHLEQRVGLSADDLNIPKIGQESGLPALIVHDTQDKDIPFQDAVDITKIWQTANLFKTEGLGHRRILRDENVIKVISGFLS